MGRDRTGQGRTSEKSEASTSEAKWRICVIRRAEESGALAFVVAGGLIDGWAGGRGCIVTCTLNAHCSKKDCFVLTEWVVLVQLPQSLSHKLIILLTTESRTDPTRIPTTILRPSIPAPFQLKVLQIVAAQTDLWRATWGSEVQREAKQTRKKGGNLPMESICSGQVIS
ncbi:uncharacterized protein IWZ02DRAFT_160214 [Phyllosticta citriasiana]|uniref:uncharacterized protein n=1 Tax=Phyllosticta citriasiana TaxID=595635 RepID=UPI0030FDE397